MRGIQVVECEDGRVFLGTVEPGTDGIVVRSGYVGRPVVLTWDEVDVIIPADDHPDVLPA